MRRLFERREILVEIARREGGRAAERAAGLAEHEAETLLERRLRRLTDSELAFLVETLPPTERRLAWQLMPNARAGAVLWEVGDEVADDLVAQTDDHRLLAIARQLHPDGLVEVIDHLPDTVRRELEAGLPPRVRDWLIDVQTYPEETVGREMSQEAVAIVDTATVKEALKTLRRLKALPQQTDKLFVVDRTRRLVGVVRLEQLVTTPPRRAIADIVDRSPITFSPTEQAHAAANAFERYDLVSAPVVDADGRLLGRLTVDTMMEVLREEAEQQAFNPSGLSGEEDLFGPVWRSARQRWAWLGLNLVTAFIASRIIGVFEGSIEKLVALATLMPIVASVGGNTGNQTIALAIRGLALGQIDRANLWSFLRKECGIGLVNGAIWGSVMGAVAAVLYQNPTLGLVMTVAMMLNLCLAALVGVGVPSLMARFGRDPAMGSSVLLTFLTDSLGFFIFLALASLFLV